MIRTINKVMAPLARCVTLMVARGVVGLINDSTLMQSVQVQLLSGETRDMERFQNYGFSSAPFAGAEAACVFVRGNRDHGIVVAVDDRRYRLSGLQNGEVAIYTDEGDSVILKRGRHMQFNTQTLTINAAMEVIVNTPLMQINGGDLKVGSVSVLQHKHPVVAVGSLTGIPQ